MDRQLKELVKECYSDYLTKKSKYETAYNYYKGKTHAIEQYKMVTERSNNKCNVNFVKKFVKEETAYSVGNAINYISKSGDKKVIDTIEYYITSSWKANNDTKLASKMILFGEAYEIYYVNENLEFKSRIIDPRHGYYYEDETTEEKLFLHAFKKKFDKSGKTYIDVYTKDCIYHLDDTFGVEIKPPTTHIFDEVPVGIAKISDEGIEDTIFNDIKGLQDSYETCLSDIVNEISDFRNAYLKMVGVQLDEDTAKEMKKMGILQVPEGGNVEWVIKNINDSFIQNTLATLEGKMYELTSHINHNVNVVSNISGVALRSRLLSLEQRCVLNQQAFTELLKVRLRLLFKLLNARVNINLDYKDVKIKYTACVPQDDQTTANLINQLGDKLSLETALSLLSFIENPEIEAQKVKEQQEIYMKDSELLEGTGEGEELEEFTRVI